MIAKPPSKPVTRVAVSGESYQRRRYSSPEKENNDCPWIPVAFPKDVSVNITRNCNMILVDTLGTKSTDLVFLEEHDNYLAFKVFNGSKFIYSDIISDEAYGLLTAIQLTESYNQSNIPAIAVASKDTIFLYHRNSCVLRTVLDPMPMSDVEFDLWTQLKEFENLERKSDFESLIEQVKKYRLSGNMSFSHQMQKLTSISSISLMQDHVRCSEIKRTIQVHISAIDKLSKRESSDGFSPSIIVVGTLECQIYLLSPPKYLISEKFQLSSSVLQIKCVGSYFGDFKIYALCRDGCIYVISRNSCIEIIQFEKNPTQFILSKDYIAASFMDNCLKCYSLIGKEIFSCSFSSPILQIDNFTIEQKKFFGFMVALENKDIKIFNGRDIIFVLNLADTISAFRFGNFKGEDMALISIMTNKAVNVNILKRNSSLSLDDIANKKLDFEFSKKSKAFVDCLKREKNDAKGIFDRFQKMDILSQVCLDRSKVFPYSSMPILIEANVELIGVYNPFSLLIRTTNKSIWPAAHLMLKIQPISRVIITPNIVKIPYLPPGSNCVTDGLIDCLDGDCQNIELSCLIICKGRDQPILSTVISISVSENSSHADKEKALTYAQR